MSPSSTSHKKRDELWVLHHVEEPLLLIAVDFQLLGVFIVVQA